MNQLEIYKLLKKETEEILSKYKDMPTIDRWEEEYRRKVEELDSLKDEGERARYRVKNFTQEDYDRWSIESTTKEI